MHIPIVFDYVAHHLVLVRDLRTALVAAGFVLSYPSRLGPQAY